MDMRRIRGGPMCKYAVDARKYVHGGYVTVCGGCAHIRVKYAQKCADTLIRAEAFGLTLLEPTKPSRGERRRLKATGALSQIEPFVQKK